MAQYINKDALVAEIEKRRSKNARNKLNLAAAFEDNYLLSFLDTLEVKEMDDELQGIEKEVAENSVNAIDRKRIPIVLKGEMKAKFKNEFNTLCQTVHGIQFANVAKYIIERLCLHFAAWGVYNLKDYCSISSEEKHKMDIEVKEVDLYNNGWIDCTKQMPQETKQTSDTLQGHREWTESDMVLVWDSLYGCHVDATKNGKWMSEQRGSYTGQVIHGIIAWRPIPEFSEELL